MAYGGIRNPILRTESGVSLLVGYRLDYLQFSNLCAFGKVISQRQLFPMLYLWQANLNFLWFRF